jgi:hypothetical protein
MHLIKSQYAEKIHNALDELLMLSSENNSVKMYDYLYSLELKVLIRLLAKTDINHYTECRIKHLIIADAREKINLYFRSASN